MLHLFEGAPTGARFPLFVSAVAVLASGCIENEFTGPSKALTPGDTGADACDLAAAFVSTVEVDEGCGFEADAGTFDPVVEWQWGDNAGSSKYDDVMSTPVVGDVDGDGMPEIVVTSYKGDNYTKAGSLVILSGDTGAEEASWTNIGGHRPLGVSGVALADLEGDGTVEIIVMTSDYRIMALHADGTLVWTSDFLPIGVDYYASPTIGDLDGDGLAEVVVGRVILDHLGNTLGIGAHGDGRSVAVIADLDMDDQQEVIVGNAAYRRDGSAIWVNGFGDGWTAVADFDGDGLGEVVRSGGGTVHLIDTDGSLIWGPKDVPGGRGGPPTVADFDGDGEPEIGIAGRDGYVVFDTDGTQLWLQPTTDQSSGATGSSVFDFEGDGKWEVLYGDELTFRIFDGATGDVIHEESGHSSWTLIEYPLVVDVDADGQAELVIPSNNSRTSGWQGITVIGDAAGSWAPTTQTWNQHAYSITNINDDLTVPRNPVMNWRNGHNSFRSAGLRERPGIPAPNLASSMIDACFACGPAAVEMIVAARNNGTEDIAVTTSLAVYAEHEDGSLDLLQVLSVDPIESGKAEGQSVFLELSELSKTDRLLVRVDDDGSDLPSGVGSLLECDEDDNEEFIELPLWIFEDC